MLFLKRPIDLSKQTWKWQLNKLTKQRMLALKKHIPGSLLELFLPIPNR